MAHIRNVIMAFTAMLTVLAAVPAKAQVTQLNTWTLASSTDPASGSFNVNAGNITVSAGASRLLVVSAVFESLAAGTLTNFNATLGGTALTEIASSDTAQREVAKVWYLTDGRIPAGAAALVVSGTYNPDISGLHIYWASYSNVDQFSPINDSGANYNGAANVTFGSQIDYLANGLTFYVAGHSSSPATMTAPAGPPAFTQRIITTSNTHSSFAADAGQNAADGNYAAGTQVSFGGTSNPRFAAVVVASLTSQIRTADVSLVKSGLPAAVAIGANVTYTLVVTNNGPASADAVTLTDPLPAGMTWVSTTVPPGASCTGTAIVTCNLGVVASGGSRTVTIVATNASAGTKANTATVSNNSATEYDPNLINNSATAVTTVSGGAAPFCVIPGKDGDVGLISGVVNTYYPGTASVSAGAASITLGPARGAPAAQVQITDDDLVLVIQMQDADIDSNNTANYGDGPNPPGIYTGAGATAVNAGRYEFVRATNTVPLAGGSLTLQGGGAGNGLINSYSNADATGTKGQIRFQAVRVPQYRTAELSNVTASPWLTNTAVPIGLGTGGILAIDVQGALTLTGTAATVNGLGFRGGAGRQLTGGAGAFTDWRTLSTVNNNGSKGEGNAGTPEWVNTGAGPLQTNQPSDGYPNGSMARGAPGNAGGGSTDGDPANNDENSGGGGGSNGGAGGRGGFSWQSNRDCGGLGAAVTPALTKLVLGGGGGAGTRNNNPGIVLASGGSAGGGLMVLRAGSLTVNSGATLSANGADAYNDTAEDGGGGGGAGGSVIVTVTSGDMRGLTVRALGGRGGDTWRNSVVKGATLADRHGPGGGGGGGVIVYTSTAVPPTLEVTGGLAGYTTTLNPPDNFGALPGGIGQSLLAAPGLIPGAGSGSDCSPDLSVDLTHQETTVTPGGTATFLATVSNAGPFVSTTAGVLTTVTITFDVWLAPTAASGTGWSCGISGQVVTCSRSDALAAEFSYPPISITTNVLAGAPQALSTTATVTNGGDSNAANNTAVDPVGVRAPTVADVREFKAVRVGSAVHLRWRTSFEVNNLGFRIYRESGNGRELVTPAVIAGSALSTGKRTQHASGRRYSWVDEHPGVDAVYWLEDIDLDGTRTTTGPVSPTPAREEDFSRGAGYDVASPLLSHLGQRSFRRDLSHTAGDKAARAPRTAGSSSAAVKLLVRQDGWYRITRDELRAAGYDPGANPAGLRLSTAGVEQAILVRDGGDGVLDGADAIEFYGTGIDSQYDDARVYWLASGKGRGLRIVTARENDGRVSAPENFPFTIERKDRTVAFFSLTNNGDNENFFGDIVTSERTTNELVLYNLDPDALWDATLLVALQGGTTQTVHEVDVAVNGFSAGSLTFFDQDHVVTSFSVPTSWLREGPNEVSFVARGQGEDVSVIDYLRITYPHRYALDGAALRLTAPGGTQVTLRGLTDTSLRVVDITKPGLPIEITPRFEIVGDETTAAIGVTGRATRTLYTFTSPRSLPAEDVIPDRPSTWSRRNNAADFIVIAHPSLLGAVEPLLARRRAQGLATALVDVTDVYDEFAFGQRTPYALRDFLQQAVQNWRKAPRSVLLVGDATFDPKDYLGFGDLDLVPTKFVPTAYLKASSDDWLVDFDADGLPNRAVGRLPARTADDATRMVLKILRRESAIAQAGLPPSWGNSVLLVSDENYEFDFEAATASLKPLVPSSLSVHEVAVDHLGATAPAEIVSRINDGQLLVNYTGHGSVEQWSRLGIFGDAEAAALENGDRLPVFVLMTCLNGMFADLFTESLAEALLLAPNGGGAAVWASSGLTEPSFQAVMNRELFRQLFKTPSVTLGEAVIRAKSAVSDSDVRRTWILFGDPTMRLR